VSHYYKNNNGIAEPFFELQKAKGGTRAVTVADARKARAYPSPNTICGILAKPGLIRWSDRLLIETVISMPQSMLEDEQEFFRVVLENHQKVKKEAASQGTAIHAEIEDAIKKVLSAEWESLPDLTFRFSGGKYGEWQSQVARAIEWLFYNEEDGGGAYIEVTGIEEHFTSAEHGLGGMIDVVGRSKTEDHRPVIVDWKTVTLKSNGEFKDTYPEDKLPLMAAYAMGYFGTLDCDCWNVFIGREKTAKIKPVLYTGAELEWGWKKFQHAYELWVMEKNYDPRWITMEKSYDPREDK